MKKILMLLLISSSVFLTSCNSAQQNVLTTCEKIDANSQTKCVNISPDDAYMLPSTVYELLNGSEQGDFEDITFSVLAKITEVSLEDETITIFIGLDYPTSTIFVENLNIDENLRHEVSFKANAEIIDEELVFSNVVIINFKITENPF